MTIQKLTKRLLGPLHCNFVKHVPWLPGPRLTLFAIVLFFTIISSFSKRRIGTAIIFDSAVYLRSSIYVLNYLKSLITFHAPTAEEFKLLVDGVMLDGPVLPILGGTFFLLLGLQPGVKDMGAALFIQALLQAASAVLVFQVTQDLTKNKKVSIISGYAWGFYPAAILGAGKFMTEILTTCLILSLVLSVTRIKKPSFGFVAGVILGLVALTKAALAPTAALAIGFGSVYLAINRVAINKIAACLLATACGVACTLGPWLIFTHQITGATQLTTNRQPTHNLVSGVNPENDGWASIPDTPLGLMFSEEDPALPSAMGIALPNATYELQLVARKIVRLFAQPWNDYRLGCLLMPLAGQIAWHKILLILSLFGMVALLMDIARKHIERTSESHVPRIELMFCLMVLLISGHFIYLPFVTCSRYAFTAMPLLNIFAVLGLTRIFSLGNKALAASVFLAFTLFAFEFNLVKVLEQHVLYNDNFDALLWASVFKFVICLVGILSLVRILRRSTGFKFLPWSINAFLVVLVLLLLVTVAVDTYCEPINGQLAFKFTNMRSMRRTCVLGADELANPDLKAAYLLIDSRSKTTILGKMIVNGHIQGLFLAPFYLVHPEAKIQEWYEMFAWTRFQAEADLNQWYLSDIPLTSLKPGKNEITVIPEPGYVLTVNGSPKSRYLQGNYVTLPSLNYFSPSLLMNDLNGLDARPRQEIYIATGKGRRIACTLDRNLDGDYDRTNLNTLVLLVYQKPADPTAPLPPPTPLKAIELYRYFVAPH